MLWYGMFLVSSYIKLMYRKHHLLEKKFVQVLALTKVTFTCHVYY